MSSKSIISLPVAGELIDPTDDLLSVDNRHYVRLGWGIVLVGFVGFLAWASLAPLDAGLPLEGKVIVSGNSKAVQPVASGKVKHILVHEGDAVQAGQLLVELEPDLPANQLDSLRFQYLSSIASENRLTAERDGLATISFDSRLRDGRSPRSGEIIQTQQQLFDSRRSAQKATLSGLEATLNSARDQLNSLRKGLNAVQQQRGVFQQQLNDQRDLADEGLLARNRLLESERQYMQLNGSIADQQGRLASLQGQLMESQQRLIEQRDNYQKDLRNALAETRTRSADLQGRLDSAEYEVSNTRIVAPVSGIVADVKVFTEGGVVSAGDHLMAIVPHDRPLQVEARLPVASIDKIHAGQKVDLEFMAFNVASTPKVPGTVRIVSADRIEAPQGEPYYNVEIDVDNLHSREVLPGKNLQPGMPVTAFVKTGERTMMSYLLKPLRDRSRMAMTEN